MIRELASEKIWKEHYGGFYVLCFMLCYVMLCYENTTDQKTLKGKFKLKIVTV